jgi:Fic family protein
MDGKGRMGRFLMNVMLASAGYPWTVIPVERRDQYMNALESASVKQDIISGDTLLTNIVRALRVAYKIQQVNCLYISLF